MKNKLSLSLCVAALVAMFACSKNSSSVAGTTKQVTIDTTVASGSLFSLALGSYGKKAVITKQADEYSVSTIVGGSNAAYQFSSNAKTSVAQQVQLAVTTDSSRCEKSDSTLVTLRLNVQ